MARKIQIKRGNKANLPTLAQGELALCMDEQSLYAGGSSGNIPIGGKAITPALIGAATTAQVTAAQTTANNAATAASNAASAASTAQTTASGKVSKAGDFMTGSLHATAFGIQGDDAYAALTINKRFKGAEIQTSDDTAEGCSLVVSTSVGVVFMSPTGIAYPLLHTGNFEMYTGLAMASIEE